MYKRWAGFSIKHSRFNLEEGLSLCIFFYPCRSVRPFIYHCALSFLLLTFMQCNWAIPHPLGPRNLPALSHQMCHWSSNVWEKAFLCKSLVNSSFFYHCLMAYLSVIFPWAVGEGYFSVIFHSVNIAWAVQLFVIFIPVIVIWAIQSDICYFSFPFIVIKPCSCFKVFNPISPYSTQLLPAPTVWTSPLTLQDYVFCSKISWFKLLLDVIVVRL